MYEPPFALAQFWGTSTKDWGGLVASLAAVVVDAL